MLFGNTQCDKDTGGICLEDLDRVMLKFKRLGTTRHVVYKVDLRLNGKRDGDIMLDKPEVFLFYQVADIFLPAARKIIDTGNLRTTADETLADP